MRRKLSVLRACRRVLRPGGRLAFLTIEPRPGLAQRDRRRANRVGPPRVAVRTGYASMLRTAGFGEIGSRDLTGEYRSTLARWIAATARREDAIRALIGDDLFEERRRDRARALAAIDAGLLVRTLYWARRPTRSATGAGRPGRPG